MQDNFFLLQAADLRDFLVEKGKDNEYFKTATVDEIKSDSLAFFQMLGLDKNQTIAVIQALIENAGYLQLSLVDDNSKSGLVKRFKNTVANAVNIIFVGDGKRPSENIFKSK